MSASHGSKAFSTAVALQWLAEEAPAIDPIEVPEMVEDRVLDEAIEQLERVLQKASDPSPKQ